MPRGNFSYVIDSSFQPFSMQELLTPFVMYKDAYEKTEEAYNDLSSKADKFKYLSETLPEGSKGRQIYEGYANELNAQAADLARNGLSMANRRSLTNLKRRYQGEIGRLDLADEAMREQVKLRNAARANGQNLLYATDNLSIDDFLDNRTPNLYNVNADELRKEGAQYAQAASGRIYGNTEINNVNKYFQEIIQRQGYSPEVMAAWRQNLESIPEFNQAINDIMEARQVNGNLTGRNYEVARQNIINGIMEGSAYQEKRSVQQNPGVLTAPQAASNALGWANHNESVRQHNLQLKMAGYDENGVYHPENDQTLKKAEAVAKAKGTTGGGSRGGSTMKDTQTSGRVKFSWHGNNPGDTNGDADDDYDVEAVDNNDTSHPGVLYSYDRLPTYVKKAIAPLVGDGRQHLYDYYFQPFSGGFFNDTEASVELVPRKVITQNRNGQSTEESSDGGFNDIPE